MNRLPIRARLTAVFVLVMAGLLAAVGLFLYYRTESDVDDAINQTLRSRAASLRASAAASRSGVPAAAIPVGERFAQLLTVDGRVLASRPDRGRALVSPADARRGARTDALVKNHERERYFVGPARLKGRRVVAVLGSSLADRERALEGLAGALLIGGPLALLLAAAIGYATAAGALSPVESIRRRAQGISRADPGAQVPVPAANDEIRRLALTLNEMLSRLAEAAAHERSFVANASHELRTPLSAIAVELELALRHGRSADDLRAAIRAAQADSARLSALASSLLELASADEHSRTYVLTPVDLDELLTRVSEDLRVAADQTGRRVAARPSGLIVQADELSLSRAVRNLADNALTHGRGAIAMGADLTGEQRIQIWIQNEGCLDDDLRDGRAFERFVRGSTAAGRPGAGLGLALVEAVAREHGGTADLVQCPDGGVRASLTIPPPVS